jgi:hypothetical protein
MSFLRPGFLFPREIRAGPRQSRDAGLVVPGEPVGSVPRRQPDVLGFQGMFLLAVASDPPAAASGLRLSLPGIGQRAPRRRFPQPASRCARFGRPEIFSPRARAFSRCRLRRRSFFFARLGNILAARPAGMTGPGEAALIPDPPGRAPQSSGRHQGGRPARSPHPGESHEPDQHHRHRPPRR